MAKLIRISRTGSNECYQDDGSYIYVQYLASGRVVADRYSEIDHSLTVTGDGREWDASQMAGMSHAEWSAQGEFLGGR